MLGATRIGCFFCAVTAAVGLLHPAIGSARVLLLDVGSESRATTEVLDAAARVLEQEHGIVAMGPSFAWPFDRDTPPLASPPELERLLARAEQQYADFDTEGARTTLEEGARLFGGLADGEHGQLLLRFHWLFAQLAIVDGEDAACLAHLQRIVRLCPWWEPPRGYLTPEAAEAFEQERAALQTVVIDRSGLAGGTGVWIDGFEVSDRPAVDVEPGMHLVRIHRPGCAAWRRWFELQPGQVLRLENPTTPSWDAGVRQQARDALDREDARGLSDLLAPMVELARADVVVVAHDATGSVHAGGVARGSWVLPPGAYSARSLAAALARHASGSRRNDRTVGVFCGELGGAGRIGRHDQANLASGGGLGLEIGGGLAVGGVLEMRGVAGLILLGPSTVESASGTQRDVLVRLGIVVGPRLPLGRGHDLWFGGGVGLGFAGMSGAVEGGSTESDSGVGGALMASLGLRFALSDGVRLGPSVSLVHAAVPVQIGLGGLELESPSLTALTFGVQVVLGP